ncbi:hypothetical protein ACQ858_20015 [Variovorax ureilyticus]|uniref:hypothetical protein n=1 Tax=Variovorax ureilyticus TaxID=1836198 RepID=UPI003D676C5E
MPRSVVFARDPDSDEPGTHSYNNRAWIEKPNGEVVRTGPAIAGEFDGMMPPGGWVAGLLAGNSTWTTRYSVKVGDSSSSMDLRARVVGESTEVVGAQVLRVVQVEYTGYTQRSYSSVALTQNQNGSYRAMLVFAPDIGRTLHFEARTRGGLGGGAYVIDEQFDLVGLR